MGLDLNAVRFLVASRNDGVSFDKTLTVGRQGLFLEPTALDAILHGAGLQVHSSARLLNDNQGFAESFFGALGAATVDSLDYSDYQGASVLADLNSPVPDCLKQRFSTVVDGGTLEHIFNLPQALKNCMEMIVPGGHFFSFTIANNLVGHGFYQFSPELFFRALSPANGFVIERMIVYEEDWGNIRYYDVKDPAVVRQRVTLVNRYPTLLMVRARRTHLAPIFAEPPQQSDYVAAWSSYGASERGAADGALLRRCTSAVVRAARSIMSAVVPDSFKQRYRRWTHGPVAFDPSFFTETRL